MTATCPTCHHRPLDHSGDDPRERPDAGCQAISSTRPDWCHCTNTATRAAHQALAAMPAPQLREAVEVAMVELYDGVHGPGYWSRISTHAAAGIVQFAIDQYDHFDKALAHTTPEGEVHYITAVALTEQLNGDTP